MKALADRISGVFVPVVLTLALLTFGVWYTLCLAGVVPEAWMEEGADAFLFSFLFAISVVVIACPCSLGLATPTAVMVGTGVAAQLGILIKGGAALEIAHKVSAIIFDKTGTLTHGKPVVTDLLRVEGTHLDVDERTFFTLVGAAESASEHPLGHAIRAHALQALGMSATLPQPRDFQAIPGRGLSCHVNDYGVLIGNRLLMGDHAVSIPEHVERFMTGLEEQGKTCMLVALLRSANGASPLH
jgi:Cu+-exporting ATPase